MKTFNPSDKYAHIEKAWVSFPEKENKPGKAGAYYLKSKWEINYAHFLQLMKEKGEIREWEYEPDIFWFGTLRRGVTNYTPDFKVTRNSGNIEYHEVKGYMDKKSATKIKRMAKYHPNVVLVVIDQKRWPSIAKWWAVIPNWVK